MSMELHVLSDRRLASIAEWQHAIDAEGFPLVLAADVDLAMARGFLPATLQGRQSGFESYDDDAARTLDFLGRNHFDRPWRHALGFRWLGSRFDELETAWMAATAYAAATAGIVFDHEEGKVFTPAEARETVRTIQRDRPATEAIMQQVKDRFSTSTQT